MDLRAAVTILITSSWQDVTERGPRCSRSPVRRQHLGLFQHRLCGLLLLVGLTCPPIVRTHKLVVFLYGPHGGRKRSMPSTAFATFNYNMDDVHRLVEAYDALKPTGQGKRGLGHLTRSSIVTLCACWEQYVEDVVLEGVALLRDQANSANHLPLQVRKILSKKVKEAKHELKPLELAGDGWRELYLVFATDEVRNLHSPKTAVIQTLLSNYLGVDSQIAEAWTLGKESLDGFVSLRNSIAHNGRAAGKYIKFWEVGSFIKSISNTVVETDNVLSDYLTDVLPNGRPWNRKHI